MSYTIKIANNEGEFAQGSHDIVIDVIGKFVILTGQDKLIADIQKIFFTEQNYFYNQYRTELDSLIGSHLNVETIKQTLAQRITNSLVYLQYLQKQQQTYQVVDTSELLGQIELVAVDWGGDLTVNSADKFTYYVTVQVSNQAGNSITVSQPINIAASSGQ